MRGGENPGGHADRKRDDHRQQCEFERERETFQDDVEHRPAIGDGYAEIAVQDAKQPAPVLDEPRLIDAEISCKGIPLRRRQQPGLGA